MVDDEIIVRGVIPGGADARPTILQRTDQEFVPALLDELGGRDGLRAVERSVVSGLPAEAAARREPGDGRGAGGRREDARASRARLKGSVAPALRLYQPVHRTFHLALLEVACRGFMEPRLDPQRIESAGLVVRRAGFAEEEDAPEDGGGANAGMRRLIAARARRRGRAGRGRKETARGDGRVAVEGWMQTGKQVRGWVPFRDAGRGGAGPSADPEADPDPARRPAPLRSGNADIDTRLAAWLGVAEPFAEATSPLFVAPPEVCKAAGRTILYGVIPVTSTEVSEPPAAPEGASDGSARFDLQELLAALPGHLPYFLQRTGRQGVDFRVPAAGRRLTHQNAGDEELERFVLGLRQLRFEFDAFGENTDEGRAIMRELNAVFLDRWRDVVQPGAGQVILQGRGVAPPAGHDPTGTPLPFGDFLKQAADVLLDLDGRGAANPPSVLMPLNWPVISAEQEQRLVGLVFQALSRRLEGLAGREGRFDDPQALYRVRAFVRVRRRDGCPPRTWWSDYSEPFKIAPWYASGEVPPVQITLPDASDPDFLKNVKPNVAFVVPESLQNLLNQNKPDDFIEGNAGEPGEGFGLDWICAFSLPLITICAFIVLNIFLQLLNIVFWWLFFIKICIPFPRRR